MLGASGVPALAADVNFGAMLVGAIPIGPFSDEESIIDQSAYGWSARGGGAGTGFGFELLLETRISKITWAGLRFEYAECGADAGEAMSSINGLLETAGLDSTVTGLDASWAQTYIGFPFRFIARDFKSGCTYVRFDIGWVKIINTYEGTVTSANPRGGSSFNSEFNFGNQFFLVGGLGVDFRAGDKIAVTAEVRYSHVFLSGAEATASMAGQIVQVGQSYDMRTVEIAVGVRIPISGI